MLEAAMLQTEESPAIKATSSRLAIASLFFLHGLCFSSWSSRIPTIQQKLSLSEASLGTMLFAIPLGSLVFMPISASLIQRYSSRRISAVAVILYNLLLASLGFISSSLQLFLALVVFGSCGSLLNVAINTQAISLEKMMARSTMASLHGVWSLAGFVGSGIGTVLIAWQIAPKFHFAAVLLFAAFTATLSIRLLLPDPPTTGQKSSSFSWPDRSLLGLGAIAFCAMICEGAMFDWSGIYFAKVIDVPPAWVGAGYTAFMCAMAGTRLLADHLATKYGLRTILLTSGVLVTAGLLTPILYPSLISGIIGFFIVGAGTSSVVPLVLGEAGKSSAFAASQAITIVSAIGFFGFLVGPPIIGWIAALTNLRFSFFVIALFGSLIFFLSRRRIR